MNYNISKFTSDETITGITMDKKEECISYLLEIKDIQQKLERLGFTESSELLKLAIISLYVSNDMMSEDELL